MKMVQLTRLFTIYLHVGQARFSFPWGQGLISQGIKDTGS